VSLSQRFQFRKKNQKLLKILTVYYLSLSSVSSPLLLSPMLSLSSSFSLRPSSLFFLYLSHSLWQRLLSSFSIFSFSLTDPAKKPFWRCFLFFFLHFICSSSYVDHFWFVFRFQLSLIKICISDFPLIYPFLLLMFNFLCL